MVIAIPKQMDKKLTHILVHKQIYQPHPPNWLVPQSSSLGKKLNSLGVFPEMFLDTISIVGLKMGLFPSQFMFKPPPTG